MMYINQADQRRDKINKDCIVSSKSLCACGVCV